MNDKVSYAQGKLPGHLNGLLLLKDLSHQLGLME